MSVGKDQLTDALNATFVTYNGNELILQNDMGNSRIQDRITGSIMGLKEGFIPLSMKEHGGISKFEPCRLGERNIQVQEDYGEQHGKGHCSNQLVFSQQVSGEFFIQNHLQFSVLVTANVDKIAPNSKIIPQTAGRAGPFAKF